MAITFDAALGSKTQNVNTDTCALTTTATAAAGSRIVVVVSFFATLAGVLSCSDGSAYTLDKQFDNGSDHILIFSRVAAAGLASGGTITVTLGTSSGVGGTLMGACSYLGTTGVDTASSTNTGTTAAAWSTGAASSTIANALYVGGAGTDGTLASESSTPGVGNERFDLFVAAANQGMVMQDQIASSIASTALTGTWGTTTGLTTQTMALAIYKGTAAGSGPAFSPSRMPLGV